MWGSLFHRTVIYSLQQWPLRFQNVHANLCTFSWSGFHYTETKINIHHCVPEPCIYKHACSWKCVCACVCVCVCVRLLALRLWSSFWGTRTGNEFLVPWLVLGGKLHTQSAVWSWCVFYTEGDLGKWFVYFCHCERSWRFNNSTCSKKIKKELVPLLVIFVVWDTLADPSWSTQETEWRRLLSSMYCPAVTQWVAFTWSPQLSHQKPCE